MKIIVSLLSAYLLVGQTYSEGDYVDNFSAPICQNGEGIWEWDVDGFNKVTWISSFATW